MEDFEEERILDEEDIKVEQPKYSNRMEKNNGNIEVFNKFKGINQDGDQESLEGYEKMELSPFGRKLGENDPGDNKYRISNINIEELPQNQKAEILELKWKADGSNLPLNDGNLTPNGENLNNKFDKKKKNCRGKCEIY